MANTFNAITSGAGGIATTGDASGAFSFTKDGGSAEVYIDSSGNVGIGTSSPSVKFQVNGEIRSTNGTEEVIVSGTNGSIEIVRTAGNPFIDFKSAIAEDFDCRIQQDNNGLAFSTGGNGAASERMRIDSSGNLLFNSGYGSVATAYGCRAWISFNGSGTIAIRGSGNVSSIVDNGTGQYTINLATAMPDTNFCTVASGGNTPDGSDTIANAVFINSSSIKMRAHNSGAGQVDPTTMSCAVFR